MGSVEAEAIAAGLSRHGLLLRGGFDFDDGDDRPSGPSGTPAGSVLLVGSAGAQWWSAFQRWIDTQPHVMAEPLDSWALEIVGRIADDAGARLVMPNDRPYAPFQQWAVRAEGLKPSPIGLLMHPGYGLWHAYRAALLFDGPLAREVNHAPLEPIHLCDACTGKPCMKSCPVGAHSAAGFAYQNCLDQVRGSGGALCREGGCLDRNACPHGTDWRYPPDVQAFFQSAFAGLT
ncbi:MAG: hypothetical protein WDZ83_13090 [Rhizobiaceae bacterium]